ncbi:zinc finger protein 2 homolog isoform X5 [Cryptotermes secundus]|nr:zinc finger protein 2 homolog isoform X5 [Cryptotermes secundus]
MSSLNYMELCRLCLVKERVSIPIFEGEGNVRQIFLKIASCLPVKVARDDKLPKKICSDCMYKLDNAYQFWNTTANAEKQLLQWLGEIASDDKKSVPSNTIETEQLVLKEEAVEQDQGSELAKGLSRVEAVLADDCKGGSEDEDESESEDEGSNSEDSGEDDGGEAPSKEEAESDEEPYGPLEPTTFVNVSLAGCDEAGPSGMQQQQQEQQQQEQQHHQQEQQQGPQQSQSLQQVQQSSQSQFLTPGAPSTSTAAPTSASGYTSEGLSEPLGNTGGPKKSRAYKQTSFLRHRKPSWKTSRKMHGTLLTEFPNTESEVCGMIQFGNFSHGPYLDIPVKLEIDAAGEQNFLCSTCSMCFETSELLASHMSTHEQLFPFSCDVYNNKFTSSQEVMAQTEIRGMEKRFYCNFCDYATAYEYRLELHYKKHSHEFTCNTCGKSFHSEVELQKHATMHVLRKSYRCDVCSRQYLNKKKLVEHKKLSHSDAKGNMETHNCVTCGKSFLYKSTLLLHQASHTGEKPYTCEQCGVTFRYKHGLYSHKRSLHPKVKLEKEINKCEVCGKAYAYKNSLVQHLKTHMDTNNKKMNQCEFCGKTYAYKKSLMLHMNSHTGANIYICDVCGKSLSSKEHLKFHCRIHTGEKTNICDVCGKAFIKSCNLKQHRRVHTGERPFKCEICGKAFTQHATLTIHRRLHTGQRPYQCEWCEHEFICQALLTVHKKSCKFKSVH